MALGEPRQRTEEGLSDDRLSERLVEMMRRGQVGSCLLPLCGLRLSGGGCWVPGHLSTDDDTAVGDTGPVPPCPVLGVFAPMLEVDIADAGRVIREGVGDLCPPGIAPLFDGHRWGLEGGQDDVVG